MKLAFLSFTEKGSALAATLAQALGGTVARCGKPESLAQWTEKRFTDAEGLVFVGAVGIAVRAIAPFIGNKWTDPAVVAVDECAKFAIPLLSGHLGGANSLARAISQVCGAQAVITTATDVNGVFAVDEWARRQGLEVMDPQHIKVVSGNLLAGKNVTVYSSCPVVGNPPQGVELVGTPPAHVAVSVEKEDCLLSLVPRILVLGVGCRKGTPQTVLEEMLERFLEKNRLWMEAICAVATIDLKKEEPGLLAFCQSHGWELHTCTGEELERVPGEFTSSAFVRQITGVDNVCERSAVAVSGGSLVAEKFAAEGVTMAAAVKPFRLDWRWDR